MTTKTNTAAIIAVGTEITSGQTANTHATWISAQLEEFGIKTTIHLATPDDHDLMLTAFNNGSQLADFIFITGGLGPTRDDFTRNVVADWLKLDLEFDESCWSEIQSLMTSRNVKISPSHKNQCHYPKGSQVLRNGVGTAHGFYLEKNSKKIWVLPGPTPEMRYVWINHVIEQLKSLGIKNEFEVLKWRCLGKPESELADLVESAVHGCGLQTGYRIASPYVEIKIWMPSNWPQPEREKLIQKLESEISPWLVVRGTTDLGYEFLKQTLSIGPLTVIDDATNAQLFEKLMAIYREKTSEFTNELRGLISTSPELEGISFGGTGATLRIIATDDKFTWWVEIKTPTVQKRERLSFQPVAKSNVDRLGKVITELSLKKALEMLGCVRQSLGCKP